MVGIVDRGQAEEGRDLAEADRPDAAVGVAAHLGGGQFGIPQRDQAQRDEPAVGFGPAPLLDHPVVVGLDAQERELLVLGLGEGLAAEAGEGREAQRRLEVVDVHVLEPGLDLVGARAHVLVGHAPHGHLVAGHADGGVDPQQRALQVLVVPPVGGKALRAGHHGELAADEGDLPHRGTNDPRPHVVILLRKAVHPHVGRFHHVVVYGDDPGHVGHEASVPPGLTVRQETGRARGPEGGSSDNFRSAACVSYGWSTGTDGDRVRALPRADGARPANHSRGGGRGSGEGGPCPRLAP